MTNLPEGVDEARIVVMVDAEGELVDTPSDAAQIEVEETADDGEIGSTIFTT